MTTIHITAEQAAILDSGDYSESGPVARYLREQCQTLADATGKTCEIYHPEGYVWEARAPQREFRGWAHVSGRAVSDSEVEGYEVAPYFPGGVYAGPDQHGIYPVFA